MAESALLSQAQNIQQSQRKLAGLAGAGGTLPDLLRQAVSERFAESPLYKAREGAAQQVIAGPAQHRADIAKLVQAGAAGQPGGQILSPTQQQAILSQQQAADIVPLMSLNDLLQAQTGGMENIIGGGLQKYNALFQAAQAETKSQEGLWDRLFKVAEYEQGQREFEREMALKEGKAGMMDTTTKRRLMELESGLSSLDAAKKEIVTAKQLLGQGDVSGGLGRTSFIQKWRKRFGLTKPSESTQQLETRLASINEKLFETAGKALTATEVQILAGKIPDISQDESIILTILNELEQNLTRKQQQILLEVGNL